MSFILKEPTTFLNIKLTDTGRRMMALGNFNMSKVIMLDREIDYTIDNNNNYNIFNNRIIDAPDFYPDTLPINLDGSQAFALIAPQVTTIKQIITATTSSRGLFSGSTNAWSLTTGQTLGRNHIVYASNTSGSTVIVLDNTGDHFPVAGELVFIPWVDNASNNYMTSNQSVPATQPVLCQWYKVTSASTPNIVVDRPITGFGTAAQTSCFFYPFNGIEDYYGSGATQNTQPWNLNISRTHSVIGTNVSLGTNATEFNYYGSLEYAGTRRYFGFSSDTPAVGFIHYTNENTGNTYAEQLLEQSVELHLPMIMWHHNGENNNVGTHWGASFYDYYGPTFYDSFAKTSYRELRDGKSITAITVGRVYHKLKLLVITDQELLNVMTYKSNRNYTLPDFEVSLQTSPGQGLTTSQATGLCNSGYTYYITYIVENDPYSSGVSFGHPASIPCGYTKKIEGRVDEFGNPTYLQINFPIPNSFPFMRSSSSWDTYGWAAQRFQILINEQPTENNYDITEAPNKDWIKISNTTGNGVYNCIGYGDTSINGEKLNSHYFVLSREDYVSGSTYNLPIGIMSNMTELNFGDESFVHGTINASILATSYKSSIMVTADDDTMNSSINSTYEHSGHEEVFITEVAVLDDKNQVVAVGKPTYPIRKRNGKYVAFQLEIDF